MPSPQDKIPAEKTTPEVKQCIKEQREYDVCMHLYMTDNSASCEHQAQTLIECYKSK